MREYGQIQSAFWTNPDIQAISNEAKLLAVYLLTGPHSNGLGCYRLPDGYVQADFGWTAQTLSKGFGELYRIGFSERCSETFFIVIPKFLKWNPISNPKVAAARIKEFETIPKNSSIYKTLCDSLLEHGNHLPDGFINRIETISKGYGKQDPTRTNPIQPENNSMSGTETVSQTLPPEDPKAVNGNPNTNQVARDLLEFLNEKTGRRYQPVEANLKLVRARLKEYDERTVRQVIANRCREWQHDDKMAEYLRPATLFNATKFSQYAGLLGAKP